MARPLRIEFPGALYHVTSRGNERRPVFRDDQDCEMFLAFLAQAIERFGWSLTAWVLMVNHFHLVVHTPEPNLSRGMHWLLSRYAGWFNRRHHRSGHLFQGRFKSIFVDKETYFREVLRYAVLNPVRAQMVSRPEDYRWSSYRATAGLDAAPGWLDIPSVLALFDTASPTAQNQYQEFVLSGAGLCTPLWDQLVHGIYLGSERWAQEMRTIVESEPRSTDHPRAHRSIGRPAMHAVLGAVARVAQTTAAELRARSGSPLRRLVAWIGWHEGLATLRAIAASLRLRSEGHISRMIQRCERELGRDAQLLSHLDLAVAELRA